MSDRINDWFQEICGDSISTEDITKEYFKNLKHEQGHTFDYGGYAYRHALGGKQWTYNGMSIAEIKNAALKEEKEKLDSCILNLIGNRL